MKRIPDLFESNRLWAERIRRQDPIFFERLARHQQPDFFWIGCSDSRVTANEIIGLLPGELFVHRNVANLVREDDPNCIAALQFAVESLQVRHVIVCGHTGCGGVRAAQHGALSGPLGAWLKPLEEVCHNHLPRLPTGETPKALTDALCEANAKEQAANTASSATVRHAWAAGRPLAIHAWLYDISTGLLRALGKPLEGEADLAELLSELGRRASG